VLQKKVALAALAEPAHKIKPIKICSVHMADAKSVPNIGLSDHPGQLPWLKVRKFRFYEN
jgi:hypothetical protein